MIIMGALILLIWSLFSLADCSDSESRWERDYEIDERRHTELMDSFRTYNQNRSYPVEREKRKRTTRRVIQKDGVVIGEEIIEEDL